jgi:outer membrane lipoprotein-sorting protein
MSQLRRFRGRFWWAPVAAVVAVAAVLAGTMLANASAPSLPRRTPAQILLAMRHAKLPAAMTAVVTETANLGIPALPAIAGIPSGLSATSLLTGTHTIDIWYAGPHHLRVALPVSFGETDLRVNGSQVWLWDSHGQQATHLILPAATAQSAFVRAAAPGQVVIRALRARAIAGKAGPARRIEREIRAWAMKSASAAKAGKAVPGPFGPGQVAVCLRPGVIRVPRPGSGAVKVLHLKASRSAHAAVAAPVAVPGSAALRAVTPVQAVNRLLAAIGQTTRVTVAGTTDVAGQPAYQLAIAPKSPQSLIGRIVVAVDASSYLPLSLQVFARGSSSPAFSIGFTSITLGRPAMSNFTFTPPPGAHVKTVKLPAAGNFAARGQAAIGLPAARCLLRNVQAGTPSPALRAALRAARAARAAAIRNGAVRHGAGHLGAVGLGRPGLLPFGAALPAGTTTIGQGWLTVAAIRAPAVGQGSGQVGAMLGLLSKIATPVHGSWGSGRLLRTGLISALITSKGTILVGAVTPSVLYADASKVK